MAIRRRGDDRLERLGDLDLFSLADDDELTLVRRLGDVVEVDEGTVVTAESEFEGGDFFVLLDGTARVTRDDVEVATVGPGSFFGEMAALELRKRSATVVAASPLRLLVFDRHGFDKLLAEAPTVTRRLLREMGRRIRELEDQLVGE